jgi:hypothetical protein
MRGHPARLTTEYHEQPHFTPAGAQCVWPRWNAAFSSRNLVPDMQRLAGNR